MFTNTFKSFQKFFFGNAFRKAEKMKKGRDKTRMVTKSCLLYSRYPWKGGLQEEYYKGRTSDGQGTRVVNHIFTTAAKFLSVIYPLRQSSVV